MAITKDGDQKFGISETGFTGLVVESFTLSKNGNRVDLNDGDGEPLGAAITIGRTEVSATVQVGTGSAPAIGGEVTLTTEYDDSSTMVVTSVEKTESASDYQRFNISGYLKIN
tara:strand:+ start:5366 stop:5704 length:339 start_codon:yes stop_codon:yes gene_type:complete